MKQLFAAACGLLVLAGSGAPANADPPFLPPAPVPAVPSGSTGSGPSLASPGQVQVPAAPAGAAPSPPTAPTLLPVTRLPPYQPGATANPPADAVSPYRRDLFLAQPGGPANVPGPQVQPPLPPRYDPPAFQVSCDDGCNFLGADRGGRFIAGAGFYYMKPYFEGNPAYTVRATAAGVAPGAVPPPISKNTDLTAVFGSDTLTTVARQHEFQYDLGVAPLLWLGYLSEAGLGGRTRWWHFQQGDRSPALDNDPTGAATLTSVAPRGLALEAPGPLLRDFGTGADRLAFETNLMLDVWDFEALQDLRCGRWALLVAAGVRYAHLAQTYTAYRFNRGAAGLAFFDQDAAQLRAGHNFNGAGPTVALEVRRPLGASGLALYGSGRGSILFGRAGQRVNRLLLAGGTRLGTPFANAVFDDVEVNRDWVLPVAELELGAEYSRQVGAMHPFLRTGVVSQAWFAAGNGSRLAGNLGFLGLAVTAGVDF